MINPYIPNTDADRRAMLEVIGVASADDLFAEVPVEFRDPEMRLPEPLSEPALVRKFEALAAQNQAAGTMTSFLGGGAYRHFIPSVVDAMLRRGEFATAYTPYQPEISQGTLQTIFEFQSLVCELLGMDVANAGMYDGASAFAEACLMACSVTGRRRIAVLQSVHPHYIETVKTYAAGRELDVELVHPKVLALTNEYACLAVQQPNFFGYLENVQLLEQVIHKVGGLYLVAVEPVSLGLLKPPGAYGADIAVAEGQSLGVPVQFGGPYVGLFTCRREFLRQMPGRIVGRTLDAEGRLGYVLTLQAREQHIRRERATSNICTSEQLLALAVTVYLSLLGPQGLREVATQCYHKAHYAADQIARIDGYSLPIAGTFFNEFVVRCPGPPAELNRWLLRHGIIGGLDISDKIENGMLLCVTEVNTRAEIDRLLTVLAEFGGGR